VSHPVESPSIYRFGVFEADLPNRELRKHGIRIRLQEQPFLVLIELLRRPGEVVTREELRHQLWPPDTFVDFDEGVNTAVKRLRNCLGDSFENPTYIETVSRYGYRLIAPVASVTANDKPVPVTKPSREVVLVKPMFAPAQNKSKRSVWDHPLLRFSLIFALVVLAAIAIYGGWERRNELSPGTIKSIVVLPLENLSADASQEYFANGITDEITTALAKLSGPKVISRTSAMQYRDMHKSVPEIARELSVDAVMEGSFERSGDRVRVRVQLIGAATDQHLWADEYDRNISDIFGLEAEIAQDIAEHIQLQLSERQKQALVRTHSINPRAFQDYLQGRHYWALRTKESLYKAIEYFNRAIQEDPNDAHSYAGLAHCYIVLPMLTGTPQDEAVDKAKDAASKAIALDDSLAEAHLAIAEALLYQDWDFVNAEKEFRQTLELNPNYSTAHQWYGEFLSIIGRNEEAMHEEQAALTLDPLSAIVHHQAGTTLRDAGHYEEAIQQYREAVKIEPNFLLAYEAMSWAFRREGKIREAIQALREAAPAFQRSDNQLMAIISDIDSLEAAYNRGGKIAYFRQCLKAHRRHQRLHYYLARDYSELEDRNAAIAELTSSYQNHDIEALWMLTDPELDPLRSDPRFQRLIRAIGFPH
jgi:TolB-like protein/DNA-binding winged helix-turn-helix (wHTH) protein